MAAFEGDPWSARPWGTGDIRPAMNAFIVTHWHSTPFHKACYEDDRITLRSLLDSQLSSEYLSSRDQFGWMAIHVAAFMNRVEILKLLLSRGTDPFAITCNPREFTALHLACSRGHTEVVRLIVAITES